MDKKKKKKKKKHTKELKQKNQPRGGGVKEPDFGKKAADANVGRWIGFVVDRYRSEIGTAFKSYRVQTTPRH